jgi:CDP-diacylglycerol---serine O-phosphatidyltransferase
MSDIFPPFAPDPNEPRRRLFKPVPFRMIAPNMITLIALCLGLTAIRWAYEGRLEPAVYFIVIAAALDGVDGRVARFLKSTSRFGAELDSLSDFVNFGVAPALVLYSFILHDLRALGWIVALVFAIAAGLRLARFNVMLDDPNRPEWKKNFFVGMAAPAGAIAALLPIYLYFLGVPVSGLTAAWLSLLFVLLIAFLMVSTIPTFSGKTMGKRIPRDWVLPLFVVTVAFFGLLVSFPFEVLAAGTIVYLAAIPIGAAHYRQLDRAEAGRGPAEVVVPSVSPAPNEDQPGRPLH